MEIVLANGEILKLGESDTVRTFRGNIKASDVSTSDVVAFDRICTIPLMRQFSTALGDACSVAYLLGQITGDGDNGCSIELCVGAADATVQLEKWFRDKLPFFEIKHRERENRVNYLRISHSLRIGNGTKKTEWHSLVERCGLKVTCYEKRIPDDMMQSADSIKLSYLAGLWDSDGCIVKTKNGYCCCHFTSVSHRLIDGVKSILRHFGIRYFVVPNRIHIVDTEMFRDLLQPYLVVKKFDGKLLHGFFFGDIPRSAVKQAHLESGLSKKRFCEHHGISRFKDNGEFISYEVGYKCGIVDGVTIYHRIKHLRRGE